MIPSAIRMQGNDFHQVSVKHYNTIKLEGKSNRNRLRQSQGVIRDSSAAQWMVSLGM